MLTNYKLLENYHNTTYTHNYIIGAKHNGYIIAYFIKLNLNGLYELFNSYTTSRQYKVLRYNSNKEKIAFLEKHAYKTIILCDIATFENNRRYKTNCKGQRYQENRGEYFEFLVAEYCNGKQNDISNIKHTDSGDVEIDGKFYQVKFEKSSIRVGKVR